MPHGQRSVAWFALAALLGIVLLLQVEPLVRARTTSPPAGASARAVAAPLLRARSWSARSRCCCVLIFSKYFYIAGLSSYYTFYLIDSSACRCRARRCTCSSSCSPRRVGTLVGGPIGDRIGRKPVIWVSILGVLPFALLLPHADLFWTTC